MPVRVDEGAPFMASFSLTKLALVENMVIDCIFDKR